MIPMSTLRMIFLDALFLPSLSFIILKIARNWTLEVLVDHYTWRTMIPTIVQEHRFQFYYYSRTFASFTLLYFCSNSLETEIGAWRDRNQP